jgi:hypothetical protein
MLMSIENVMYSNKVKKFNRFEWTQERSLVITDKKIYNFKKLSKGIFIPNVCLYRDEERSISWKTIGNHEEYK